jgi:hypothetical protein
VNLRFCRSFPNPNTIVFVLFTFTFIFQLSQYSPKAFFTKTCNFDVTKKHLADKVPKAMYEVLKMGRLYKLSVKIQLDLFDKMIKYILLYGCEVQEFGKIEVLERVHLKFCKIPLNLSPLLQSIWFMVS